MKPWVRIVELGAPAVLLIRHGRTAYNADRRFCGARSNPPLDDEGRAQVDALAERLDGALDHVFCSPQQRARETAAGLGFAEPTILDGLRELDQGVLEGQSFASAMAEYAEFFRAWKRDPTAVRVPGGESMRELAERVSEAVDTALASDLAQPRDGRGRVIGIVGHQMAQAAFCAHALELPMRDWPKLQLRNAQANLLTRDGDRWHLVAGGL